MKTSIIFLFYFIINYVNGFNFSGCKKMGVINTELDSFTYQVYFCLESKIKFININDTKARNIDKNLSNITFTKNISVVNSIEPYNFSSNTSIVNKTIKPINPVLISPSPDVQIDIDNVPYIYPSVSPSVSQSVASTSYKKTNLRSRSKYTSSTINKNHNTNETLKVIDSSYININNTNMSNVTNTTFVDPNVTYKDEVNIAITISCSIVLFFLMMLIYYVAYKRYKKNRCKNKICPELILENGNSKKQSGEKLSKSAKKYLVSESTDEISNVDSEVLKEEAKIWYVNEFKNELDLLPDVTDISDNNLS